MLSAIVGRDDDIEAIVGPARQARKPTPRWLWITAAVVGAICAFGFAIVVFGDRAASSVPAAHRTGELGFGTGLLIGAGVGVVIGFSLGRQRRSHSSRSSP